VLLGNKTVQKVAVLTLMKAFGKKELRGSSGIEKVE
jgi:hypothetical protein